MEREQRRSRKIRLLIVGALLIALTISYLIILHNMRVSEQPGERMFGASDSGAAAEVYLEPLSIDAANEGMQVRAYLSPNLSNGKNARAGADRDLTLLITHDQTVEEIKLAAGAHMASSTFEVDLNDGSVIHYPFELVCGAPRRPAHGGKGLAQPSGQDHRVGGGARLQSAYDEPARSQSE